jgi:hypothetical protein
MIKLIIILTSMLAMGCNPSVVEISESETVEESPITWNDCSYTVADHPCDFELKDENNKTHTLYEYYGQPIVLDLSAMWCGYCQVAASESESFQLSYSDHNLIWITVLFDDLSGDVVDQVDLQSWVDNFALSDTVTLAGSRDMIDTSGVSGFPVQSWPMFIFINDEMEMTGYQKGWSSDGLRHYVDLMISENDIEN